MPTKHIDEKTWRKVESKTVEVVIATKKSISPEKMLKLLILKGLENFTEDDATKAIKK